MNSPIKRVLGIALAAGLMGSVGHALAGGGITPAVTGSSYSRALPTPSRSSSADVSESGYQNGPGWTVAQVKRMAKKRRNQNRNKREHRAKGGR